MMFRLVGDCFLFLLRFVAVQCCGIDFKKMAFTKNLEKVLKKEDTIFEMIS